MGSLLLQEISDKIDSISPSTQYWFIRTNGGVYFDEFVRNGFIAIGYNSITINDVKYSKTQPNPFKNLSDKVKFFFPNEKRPGYIANQIFDFVYNIKKDDIVLIPSTHSDKIAIGTILESATYDEIESQYESKSSCKYNKRKRVKFLKIIPKHKLEPNLFKIIFIHRALTRIEPDVAKSIDRTTNTLFVKGEKAHFVVRIESQKDLNALNVFSSFLEIFELADEFGKSENIIIDTKKVAFKSNLNSPGTVELIGLVETITIIALIAVFLVGANFEIGGKLLFNMKIQSDGILKRVSQFMAEYRHQQTIKILNSKLKGMDLKEEDIIGLLSQFSDKDDKEDKNPTT